LAPFVAVGVEQVALDETAECQDVFGSAAGPPHAGEFGALSDDVTAGSLDGARACKIAFTSECSVSHPLCIGLEVRIAVGVA
jgi:hypothetical protein